MVGEVRGSELSLIFSFSVTLFFFVAFLEG